MFRAHVQDSAAAKTNSDGDVMAQDAKLLLKIKINPQYESFAANLVLQVGHAVEEGLLSEEQGEAMFLELLQERLPEFIEVETAVDE